MRKSVLPSLTLVSTNVLTRSLRRYVTLVTTYVVRLTLGALAFALLIALSLSWLAYSFGRLIFRMLECGIRNIRRQLSRLGDRR